MAQPQGIPEFNLSASPTVYDYVMSDAFVTGIKGPVGSGKSVGSCIKILRHLCEYPLDHQGYHRCRVPIIRNTYPELKTTTVKTWVDTFDGYRVPPVVYSSPIRHHIVIHPVKFKWVDKKAGLYEGVPGIDLEVWFLALDRPADVRKLKSLECSFAFINEASELDPAIIDMLTARVGRYPKREHLVGEPWAGIFYDTNAGDETVWTEEYEANGPPEVVVELEDGTEFRADWQFYTQPPALIEVNNEAVITEGGDPRMGQRVPNQKIMYAAGRGWVVNPEAENLRFLKRGYYNQQVTNKKLEWIQRFLQAKRVYIADGEPWVPEFSQISMVRPVRYDPTLPLLVGIDAGGGTLHPAAIWGQVGFLGDWRILAELAIADIGLERFCEAFHRHHTQVFGSNVKIEAAFIDPAGRKPDEVYEVKAMDYLIKKGIPARLAPSNDIDVRRAALASPMGRGATLDSGEFVPAFLVDPSCSGLIAALAGKWFRRYVVRAQTKAIDDKPVKLHPWSDYGDAGSYLLLGGGEDIGRGPTKPQSGQRGGVRQSQGPHHVKVNIPIFDD